MDSREFSSLPSKCWGYTVTYGPGVRADTVLQAELHCQQHLYRLPPTLDTALGASIHNPFYITGSATNLHHPKQVAGEPGFCLEV